MKTQDKNNIEINQLEPSFLEIFVRIKLSKLEENKHDNTKDGE